MEALYGIYKNQEYVVTWQGRPIVYKIIYLDISTLMPLFNDYK